MTQQDSDLYIIAIGASAGGMEALHTLFDHTPTDDVSYVIIQHLSPDYKSFVGELLAKHSRLKIFKAEEDMEVVSNCVYIMPPGKNMTMAGGKLKLSDRPKATPNSAIDIFFNSLAEDQGDKSIGIVLSGNGSDGTKGVEAIKKVGGLVIVQDPKTSDFKSMPDSVIASGNYDYVLVPKKIPQQIVNYVYQKSLKARFPEFASDNDDPALLELIDLVKNQTPHDFSEYKRPTIVRRVIRRMAAIHANTIEEYMQLLKSDPEEIATLSNEFLIGVTNFFRDPEAFEIIRDKVIPEIVKNKLLVDTLKIWVIGCATGEEAYSLAILIKEHLITIKKDLAVKIFASDIDKKALAKASKGYYSENLMKNVSEERLSNFFIQEGNGYLVRENIRKMLIFADHNIVQQPPYGKIDFISCRNLMIYFNPTLQKRIFSTIHFCLNVDGYLFLGPSEGLGELKGGFIEIDKKWKIFKNTGGSNQIGFNPYSPRHVPRKPIPPRFVAERSLNNQIPEDLLEIIFVSHMEESGFLAGVCINEDNKVVLPFGDYNKFLLPKLFNDNFLELLPTALSITVGTSIKKAVKSRKKVAVQKIRFQENNLIRSVEVLVKPLLEKFEASKKLILVYFKEEATGNHAQEMVEIYDENNHTSRYLSDLNKELGETKRDLHQATLALEQSYDNIQSYNEELLSSNEEMQSSNEELQSTNEELTTLNSQYQSKIKELAELNDDFNNYFRSTLNSQLYVDKDLIIRKFTPISINQINIKESDIGRPLAHISTNIKFSSLLEDINSVIISQVSKEKNIQTTDGKWYAMVIVPYLKLEGGQSNGAIITFNDISEIIRSKQLIEDTNSKLVKINNDHDTFIYSVSHDLLSPINNIQGLIDNIHESEDQEEVKVFSGLLTKLVDQVKESIRELSAIANVDNEPLEFEKVDVEEILVEVKESLNNRIKLNLSIDFQVKEISFPVKYMRSILFNLLNNAVKYKSPARELEVKIKTEKSEGFILLSIEDNGMGIAKEKIGELFSKFKRVHDLNTNVEGTGIGLYLVKKMITNAGGEIEVESQLGKGSRFKVFIKE
ncbi:MAG: CheR family methyltransferase [Cyclobacteriaceae bacterium]